MFSAASTGAPTGLNEGTVKWVDIGETTAGETTAGAATGAATGAGVGDTTAGDEVCTGGDCC